jgi:hypothetical protein
MLQTGVERRVARTDEPPGVLYRDEWPSLYSQTLPQRSLVKLPYVSTPKYTACAMWSVGPVSTSDHIWHPHLYGRLQPNGDMASVAPWFSMREGWLSFCLFSRVDLLVACFGVLLLRSGDQNRGEGPFIQNPVSG